MNHHTIRSTIAILLAYIAFLAACTKTVAILTTPSQSPTANTPITTTDTPAMPTATLTFSPPTNTPSPQPDTASPTPSPSVSATASPMVPSPPGSRTHYVLDATINYTNHSLAVTEQVVYTNTTWSELSNIALVIEPRRYPGAFDLTSLTWQDSSRITHYQLRDNQLTLLLPQALLPGQSLDFSMSFNLQLPYIPDLTNLWPHPFGYTDSQANLGDWYPFIPPYVEGKGWLIHEPVYYGEHLVYDIADFEVLIQSTGMQTDLVFAASSPAEMKGGQYRYQHPAARSFAWSASPYYQVVTQTVPLTTGQVVTVASYFFPFYEKAGNRIASTMAQALPLYSRLLADYPHPMLSAVQADFLDGMEYEGLYFLSTDFYNWYDGTDANFLVALTAHETMHQWWYGLVGNDQALEPWLDETLCTYSEHIFYENTFPDALDWWWEYRIKHYNPKGFIDIGIYDFPSGRGHYRTYRDAVYLNGALFMEDLRLLIGNQAFFAALQEYTLQNSYGQANAASFFEMISKHSQADLTPLWDKYFSKYPPKP